MEIKKGRTLTQLIKYLYSEWNSDMPIDERMGYCFHLVVNWVQFCEQKPKKEMFINELKEPDPKDYAMETITGDHLFYDNLILFSKAEGKVIFKDVTLIGGILRWKDKVLGGHFKDWDDVCEHMTIGLIFEKTNGELETNIEI